MQNRNEPHHMKWKAKPDSLQNSLPTSLNPSNFSWTWHMRWIVRSVFSRNCIPIFFVLFLCLWHFPIIAHWRSFTKIRHNIIAPWKYVCAAYAGYRNSGHQFHSGPCLQIGPTLPRVDLALSRFKWPERWKCFSWRSFQEDSNDGIQLLFR